MSAPVEGKGGGGRGNGGIGRGASGKDEIRPFEEEGKGVRRGRNRIVTKDRNRKIRRDD